MGNPIRFKRGSTFSFVFEIPEKVPNGFFEDWLPEARIRRSRNSSPSGLIADLSTFWLDEGKRKLVFYHNATDDWPLGLAEMDVFFRSVEGDYIPSNTILFEVIRGITR